MFRLKRVPILLCAWTMHEKCSATSLPFYHAGKVQCNCCEAYTPFMQLLSGRGAFHYKDATMVKTPPV